MIISSKIKKLLFKKILKTITSKKFKKLKEGQKYPDTKKLAPFETYQRNLKC